MTTRANAPISEQDVRDLAEGLREPDWLLNRRLDAFRASSVMSMPDPLDEQWRRTDISGLDLDSGSGPQNGPHAAWHIDGNDPAAFAERLRPGFFFGDIEAGLGEHEDAIRERLHSLVKPAEWKLGALQAALWQGGTLVYVPRNTEIEVPLEHVLEGGGGQFASHVLIIAEANSSVTFVREAKSDDGAPQSLALGAVEIFAAQDARVRFVDLQCWGSNTYAFETIRARLDRGAELTAALIGLGSRLQRTKLEVELAGEGARAELLGLTYGSGEQHFDYVTLQDHVAPRTSSDLLFKAGLTDAASEVWTGTVHIQKGASASEAGQASRNLLLSNQAKAAPIPVLEIEAYDILRCSHGASAGPLDEEQRFYLESRGIPPAEAQQLLVDAFFREVIDRLPVETVRQRVSEALAAKIGTRA